MNVDWTVTEVSVYKKNILNNNSWNELCKAVTLKSGSKKTYTIYCI